jgi:hypothetical protein
MTGEPTAPNQRHPTGMTNAMTAAKAKTLAEPAQKGRPGRKPKPIDLRTVYQCAMIGCITSEIAAICRISQNQLFEHMKRDPAIREAIEQGQEAGKVSLRRRMHRRAMSGSDTMLIWMSKNRLGMRDRFETEHGVTKGLEQVLRELAEIEAGQTAA